MIRNHGPRLAVLTLLGAALCALPVRAATKSSLSASDRHFLNAAIMGSMAEVQLGHLALQKAAGNDVRQFAQEMINDHSRASGKFVRTAGRKGVVPPTTVGADALKTYKRLSALEGAAFDRAYMQAMLEDHQKDVAEFKNASRSVRDRDLHALVVATLPVLQSHLEMARKMMQSANP